MRTVVIIGGGAAGFFAAANLVNRVRNARVILLEKSNKLLSKVRISGGGRCNVTNSCFTVSELIKNYPRGGKQLKKVFHQFAVPDTIRWFEERGVSLKTEDDGRMFPYFDSSQQIIDCLLNACDSSSLEIRMGSEVTAINHSSGNLHVKTNHETISCVAVLVAAGGFNKISGYHFLQTIGHHIIPPIPSLFTINIHKHPVHELMGVSVSQAEVKVAGTSLRYSGPVLITHWGFSGPAVLKLSAFAAEFFHERHYVSDILINWTGEHSEEQVRSVLQTCRTERASALPVNTNPFQLPMRLWEYLLQSSEINCAKNWSEQTAKALYRLVSKLSADVYRMEGKTTFKEEFVTCGGIDLAEVDMHSMESKLQKGLFFAGEILNIDGITGGFNFQAAWSTAFVAASTIAERLQ